MAELKKKPYWCDQLFEKHECFGYDKVGTIKLDLDRKKLQLIVPKYFPKFDVLKTALNGDILFVLGKQCKDWSEDMGPLGVVVVARRENEKQFSAVLWHETYPWFLEKIGLVPVKPRKKRK